MEHWIDKLRRERDQEQRRQEYFTTVFPVLVKELWGRLCMAVTEDLKTLHQRFPELLPKEVQADVSSDLLQMSVTSLSPHYHLAVVLDMAEQTLIVGQMTVYVPGARTEKKDIVIMLAFDEPYQRVQLSRGGQILSPEEFSELCLSPIVSLHPVPVRRAA